jgi:enoyl-CoA hydratase/carnithine racemase
MAYDSYALIDVMRHGAIITATVNNPPINLVTLPLFAELAALAIEVEADATALVFVLKSANPDFFLAHFDVEALIAISGQPRAEMTSTGNAWHEMCGRFATMNKLTIAQIEGRVGGGGAELSMSFDMRFGVTGKTIVNQMEVPIGIIPGGTGTQRLPRLIGHARAMEVILSGNDLDAETAERWGWLNRALPADVIDAHVTALAGRVASFPPAAVRAAKQAIFAAALPLDQGLAIEAALFQDMLFSDDARAAMARFMALGGQTRDGEMRVADLSGDVARTG